MQCRPLLTSCHEKQNSLLFHFHYSMMRIIHYLQMSTFRMWIPLWQRILIETNTNVMVGLWKLERGKCRFLQETGKDGCHRDGWKVMHSPTAEWTGAHDTTPGDTSHIALMCMVSSGEAQFQKTLWMACPEWVTLPQTRAEFKDNNIYLERDSSSYLYFYFKPTCFKSGLEPHLSQSMPRLLRVKTQMDLLIQFLQLGKGQGRGCLWEFKF